MEEELKILNLNSYEIKIYLSLLKKPQISANEIAKESKVPQNRVYDTVENLIKKELVTLIPQNPKKYAPKDPKIIKKLIKEKIDSLNKLNEEFTQIEKEFKSIKKQKVILSRTTKNFHKIIDSIPKPKKFSYSIKPQLSTQEKYIKKDKELIKNKVDVKILSDNKLKNSSNHKKWKKINQNIKFINTQDIIFDINENGVLISLLPPKNESLILYIENKNLSNIMKNMYESYYNSQK